MKKSVYIVVCLVALALLGCQTDSKAVKAVIGPWKSVQADSLTGKPNTVVLTEKRLTVNGQSADVTLSEENGVVLVKLVGSSDIILRAVPQAGGKARFTNVTFDKDFQPSTESEVKDILAQPSKLQSKPDPF